MPRSNGRNRSPFASAPYMARIRVARLALGLSQDAAGAHLGWKHANWSAIERGAIVSPTLDTVRAMAGAVGLSLDLVPEGTPPPEYLPPLDAEQVRAIALLAVWYREKNPGCLPHPLASAIEILRDYADRPPHKQARPGPPKHDRVD